MNIVKFNSPYLVPQINRTFDRSFDRTLDRFFDDFFVRDRSFLMNRPSLPAVNVYEDEQAFRVEVALLGFQKEDITLSLSHQKLKISANKKPDDETATEKQSLHKEFSYCAFERTFSILEHVNLDAIQANYEDGILKITLPKTAPQTPIVREIEIS